MYGYNLALIAQGNLLTSINDTETELEMYGGQGANFIPTPCVGVLAASESLADLANAEHVAFLSRSGDVYQVRRQVIGSGSWPSGTLILGYWSPEHIYQVQRNLNVLEYLIYHTLGRREQYLVFEHPGASFDLSIVSGMEVQIEAGCCISNYLAHRKATTTNFTFEEATGDTRIDIIQANPDTQEIELVQGVEGGGDPTLSDNAFGLWKATITVGLSTVIPGTFEDLRT